MAEPTSSSAVVGAIAATSVLLVSDPSLGDYAWIVFGGLIGAMHSVAKASTDGAWGAARYLFVWVGTAFVLSFFVAYLLDRYVGIPAHRWPGVVAFFITFLADRWPSWLAIAVAQRLGVKRDGGGQ